MASGFTDEQNARLRRAVMEELSPRVPQQLYLAPLLNMSQPSLSRFLDGSGATGPVAIRIAILLNRSVEELLGLPEILKLEDPQEKRYPSRILAARAAYADGVPLSNIRAVLAATVPGADPGPQWWSKMMIDGEMTKHGNKRDTDLTLKQAAALGVPRQMQPKDPPPKAVKRRKPR